MWDGLVERLVRGLRSLGSFHRESPLLPARSGALVVRLLRDAGTAQEWCTKGLTLFEEAAPGRLTRMNEGIAAIVGALAGSLGTLTAAIATGWASREQARITARSEFLRQRQEPREAAYRKVIETVGAVREHDLRDHFAEGLEEQWVSQGVSYVREALERCQPVKERWQDAALLGPAPVTQAAEELGAAVEDLIGSLDALLFVFGEGVLPAQAMWEVHDTARDRLANARKTFTACAQAALNDDGTLPLRSQHRWFLRRRGTNQ